MKGLSYNHLLTLKKEEEACKPHKNLKCRTTSQQLNPAEESRIFAYARDEDTGTEGPARHSKTKKHNNNQHSIQMNWLFPVFLWCYAGWWVLRHGTYSWETTRHAGQQDLILNTASNIPSGRARI
jgi:hypothetical protein